MSTKDIGGKKTGHMRVMAALEEVKRLAMSRENAAAGGAVRSQEPSRAVKAAPGNRSDAALAELRAHLLEQIALDQVVPNQRLFEALKRGDLQGVKEAVIDGANVNATDAEGKRPAQYSSNYQIKGYLALMGAK